MNLDTICAISTASGYSGIGVIRLSGPQSLPIVQFLTKKNNFTPRFASLCDFYTQNDEVIDSGLALYFPAPKSFTGEDVVELHGHGSPVALNMLLNRILELGCRLAEPGEFSRIAYLNGKIDLIQAESIIDLIHAESETSAKSALKSLKGSFSKQINTINQELINLRMFVEASLDFPEEDIEFIANAKINDQLSALQKQIQVLLTNTKQGVLLNNGADIVIIGRPNVGKSSLLNTLANEDIAIVTDIAGTTRDSIYINWQYGGQNIKLVDTAGLRKRANIFESLEKFSVGDTLEALKFAHVAVLVMDATECFEHQDLKILDLIIREGRALIMVMNKWDKVKNKTEVTEEIEYLLGKYTGKISGVTVLKTSAEKDKNLDAILQRALEAYDVWNKKIPTSALNRWLSSILQRHSPPIAKGRRIKIRYITQTKTRPPTFMLDVSLPDALPDSYMTFLTKDLRESFGMPGTPLRIHTPKKSNPFASAD